MEIFIELEMDKGLIGKTLRKDSKECVDKLSKLSIAEIEELHKFIDNGLVDLVDRVVKK